MVFEQFVVMASAILGCVGGCLAWRFPASGKAALALAVVPAAGIGLAMAFC